MKTPTVQTWEMALGCLVYNDASGQFDADAPTLAGIFIRGVQATGEASSHPATLPPGCVFAVRYVSR